MIQVSQFITKTIFFLCQCCHALSIQQYGIKSQPRSRKVKAKVREANTAFTEVKTCCYCTEDIPRKTQTSAKCLVSTNELHFTPNNLIQTYSVLDVTPFFGGCREVNSQGSEGNTLEIITNVLIYSSFDSPRHSGFNVGNNNLHTKITSSRWWWRNESERETTLSAS